MAMSSLADRIKLAFDQANPKVTKAAIARACKIASPSVVAWFSGDSKSIKGYNLVVTASMLGVNPLWLADGRGPMRGPAKAGGPPTLNPRDLDPKNGGDAWDELDRALAKLLIVGPMKDEVLAFVRGKHAAALALQEHLNNIREGKKA